MAKDGDRGEEGVQDSSRGEETTTTPTTPTTSANSRSHTIEIFARFRPTSKPTPHYEVLRNDEQQGAMPHVVFTVPRETSGGYVNNQRETFNFQFHHVFDQGADQQEEVFEHVAKRVVLSVLDGINGTIFAYGQTGSGKTFTITGGPEKYSDRGIIPRALSFLFAEIAKVTGRQFQVHISYLQVYNENGYDLLDPSNETKELEDLPQVTLHHDEDNNVHLRNLGQHPATGEDEALKLLFLGDTNRMIAETPMNLASSRSHCIFTVHVLSRDLQSDKIRRSKLHLVDLAGSERVGKTGVGGHLLREACSINLSLHYLEAVIIGLHEKAAGRRTHIPYRNSFMTSLLKDSLGGNCLTVMIATLSAEREQASESISTCRFAQRVALISNVVAVNEEIDPQLLIRRLRREIQQLKEELAFLRGGNSEDVHDLSEEEKSRITDLVHAYVEDISDDATLSVGIDLASIREAFRALRSLARDSVKRNELEENASSQSLKEQIAKLKSLVQQRENEINILVNMVNKSTRAKGPTTDACVQTVGRDVDVEPLGQHIEEIHEKNVPSPNHQAASIVMGREEALQVFLRSYSPLSAIDENQKLLQSKMSEAKALGELVNDSRNKINSFKALIEQLRVERAMQGLLGSSSSVSVDPEEERNKTLIEKEKLRYKQHFEKLSALKSEIEHIDHLLHNLRLRLDKDFEEWYSETTNKNLVGSEEKPVIQASRNDEKDEKHATVRTGPLPQGSSAPVLAGHRKNAPMAPTTSSSSQSLTGNSAADADIAAFYKLRDSFFAKQRHESVRDS